MEQRIKDLFYKYLSGKADQQDIITLYEYFDMEPNERHLIELINEHLRAEDLDASEKERIIADKLTGNAWAGIKGNLEPVKKPTIKRISIKWISAIAALLLLTLSFGYLFLRQNNSTPELISTYGADVLPGTNKARIVLSDGTSYDLSEQQSGITIDGSSIRYVDGSSITSIEDIQEATIITPKGGQYSLTLPDQTKVILNANSTMKYPTRFSGPERRVELNGEGYFEVAKNPNHPFIVTSGKQTIKVLGTHFNLYAYTGEQIITTLLEGSVRLNFNKEIQPIIMKPGQQVGFDNQIAKVSQVNPADYMAWTKNLFSFNDVPLSQIFLQLERWYDIEITYPADIGKERFYAEIPRDRKLSEVLPSFGNQLKFKIEGRRITVTH